MQAKKESEQSLHVEGKKGRGDLYSLLDVIGLLSPGTITGMVKGAVHKHLGDHRLFSHGLKNLKIK